MNTLPSQGLLASYWIPQVGIGPYGQMDYVDVPLTDVPRYTLPNVGRHDSCGPRS